MIDDEIISSKNKPLVVESLIETVSEDELESFMTLKSIDIDIE